MSVHAEKNVPKSVAMAPCTQTLLTTIKIENQFLTTCTLLVLRIYWNLTGIPWNLDSKCLLWLLMPILIVGKVVYHEMIYRAEWVAFSVQSRLCHISSGSNHTYTHTSSTRKREQLFFFSGFRFLFVMTITFRNCDIASESAFNMVGFVCYSN